MVLVALCSIPAMSSDEIQSFKKGDFVTFKSDEHLRQVFDLNKSITNFCRRKYLENMGFYVEKVDSENGKCKFTFEKYGNFVNIPVDLKSDQGEVSRLDGIFVSNDLLKKTSIPPHAPHGMKETVLDKRLTGTPAKGMASDEISKDDFGTFKRDEHPRPVCVLNGSITLTDNHQPQLTRPECTTEMKETILDKRPADTPKLVYDPKWSIAKNKWFPSPVCQTCPPDNRTVFKWFAWSSGRSHCRRCAKATCTKRCRRYADVYLTQDAQIGAKEPVCPACWNKAPLNDRY